MKPTTRAELTAHAVAVAAVAGALGVRLVLEPLLGEFIPYASFFVAVVAAAWFGGLRPALVAVGLSAVLSWYFFVPPRFSLAVPSGPHLVGLVMFFVAGVAIAGIGEAVRVAQRRFAEQAERLRTTLASIGDAVITTDTEGRVTNLNPVAEGLTGWANAAAIGQPLGAVFNIVNESTRRPAENPAARALKEGVIVGLANHTVLIARDGTERPIDDSAAPIRCAAGEVVGCVLVFRDVTERRCLERQIAGQLAASRFLAAIVESSDDAIVSKSQDGIIQSWNLGAERLFGYPAAEAIGRHISLVIPPDRADEEERILARIRAGEAVEHLETVRLRRDGRPIHVSVTTSPIRDEQGRVVGASKIARDITARWQAARRLAESEARKAAILDSALDCVITIDHEGRVVDFNRAAERTFGYRRADVIGKEMGELIVPPALREGHRTGLARYLATGEGPVLNRRVELTGMRADGTEFPVELAITPIPGDGHPLFTGHLRDITERKEMEDRLRQYVADLSEADRRKDEFLATLAHELRNPLAPIRNGLQMMRLAGGQVETVEQARAMMERQLAQLVRLVDDLMDVSRITRGKLELKTGPVPLADVIGSAVETSRPLIEEMGHEFTVALPPQPVVIDADLTRLAQVFANLLNNAAKYTDRGGRIRLTAERQGGEVVVAVRDDGIGIAADQLPRIFGMFSQVDRSLEKAQGGLGIGLMLVKRLVEMHGGTVEPRSGGAGQGSEFVVRLPLMRSAELGTRNEDQTPIPHSESRTPHSRRILIVDDNRDGADSLAVMLRLMGNETHTAYDGEQGAAAAGAVRPDVILFDIGLPKLNGYEACRRIRREEWGRDMVLIAVTGWGQEEDRRRSKEAGFDHHLVKPVDPAALLKLLAELTAKDRS